MSFASILAVGLRQNGSSRLPAARRIFIRPCRCSDNNNGLLSTSRVAQRPSTSRNFSLWPSSKAATAPLPPPTPPLEEVVARESVVTPERLETTTTTTEPIEIVSADSSSSSVLTPEIPEAATSTVSDIVHNIPSLPLPPSPLQFGDFSALGLTGFSPAGVIRWTFEIINVTTGMPWFWTIVAGSVFWRLACVPFTLKAARTAAIMQPHQKELAAIQERVKRSAGTQNALELMKANRALKEYYKKLGVSPFGGLVGLLQVPVTLGMFFAVKKMCDLPVEQLKFSGFEMFPDLTVVDPTMTLPIAMTVAMNLQLLISARDIAPNLKPMLYLFHFLSVPGFFFLKDFPVALLLSIMTTALLTTAQTLLLRVPAVRTSLRMPLHAPAPPDQGHPLVAKLKSLLFKNGNVKDEVAHARRQQASRRRKLPS